MTPAEIKQIVELTVSELRRNNMLETNPYKIILPSVEKRLKDFFGGNKDRSILNALRQLSDDEYIDVIYYHYRDKLTIERIAGYMERDITTIKRNKRRLIMQIHRMIDD